jgi:hypothetical protein
MEEQKELRLSYWTVVTVAIAVGCWLFYWLGLIAVQGSIDHPVAFFINAYAESGRIPLADLNPVGKWLLLTGYVFNTLSEVALIALVVLVSKQIVAGEIFSNRTFRLFRLFTIALVGCFLARYIELMGANAVANQFDAKVWYNANGVTCSELLVLSAVFILCSNFVTASVRRGIRLQEEQEGLV